MNNNIVYKIANEITTMYVNELLEHPFSKIAMSAGELIFRTSRRSIKYAKGCVATSKRNEPRSGRWTFGVRCHEQWSKGPYDVRFKLVQKKGRKTQGILGREIEVSCNCNAWKYNGADYNALSQDYSERQYSNGQLPNIRDPHRKYLICKHVAACVPLFKNFIIPEQFKQIPNRPLVKPLVKKLPFKKILPEKQPDKQLNVRRPLLSPKTPKIEPIRQIKTPGRIKPLRQQQKEV